MLKRLIRWILNRPNHERTIKFLREREAEMQRLLTIHKANIENLKKANRMLQKRLDGRIKNV